MKNQFNNPVQISSKLLPIRDYLKKNVGFVYKNLVEKRNKIKPKFQVNHLDGTTDL